MPIGALNVVLCPPFNQYLYENPNEVVMTNCSSGWLPILTGKAKAPFMVGPKLSAISPLGFVELLLTLSVYSTPA